MAIKAKAKATLKAGAAIPTVKATGEVVPMRGKNEPDLVPENVIRSEVKTAFAEIDSSAKLAGSAVQRLAYAITADHGHLVFQGREVPRLAELADSSEAVAKLREHIAERFLGARPKNDGTHTFATAITVWNKHNALLNRAIELAGVLAKTNVGLAQWNDKLGNWQVPARALFPRDVTPLGDLAKQMVLLDRRGYGGTGKNKKGDAAFVKVLASVEQFVSVAKPRKPANGNQSAAGQGDDGALSEMLGKVAVDKLATAISTDKAVAVFFDLFVKNAPANAKLSDYKPELRNMLTQIVAQYDRMKHNDETAKPAAKSA